MKNREHRREIAQVDTGPAVIGLLGKTERDRARMLAANPGGVRVVGAIKNRVTGLIEQLGEDLYNRGEIGVKIEVLFFDVQHEGMLGFEELDGAVALIAL